MLGILQSMMHLSIVRIYLEMLKWIILDSILWDRSDSKETGWGLLVDQVRGVYLHWAPVPVRCQVGGQIGGVCLACGLHLPCSSSIWDCCLLRSRGRRWWEGEEGLAVRWEGGAGDGIIALGKMGNWVCVAGTMQSSMRNGEEKKCNKIKKWIKIKARHRPENWTRN